MFFTVFPQKIKKNWLQEPFSQSKTKCRLSQCTKPKRKNEKEIKRKKLVWIYLLLHFLPLAVLFPSKFKCWYDTWVIWTAGHCFFPWFSTLSPLCNSCFGIWFQKSSKVTHMSTCFLVRFVLVCFLCFLICLFYVPSLSFLLSGVVLLLDAAFAWQVQRFHFTPFLATFFLCSPDSWQAIGVLTSLW